MNKQEQDICTAPQGHVRIVHRDPRDHWPTRHADFESIDEAQANLGRMMPAQREVHQVYDDHGQQIEV